MQRAGGGEVAQHRIPQGGQQSAALGEHRHQQRRQRTDGHGGPDGDLAQRQDQDQQRRDGRPPAEAEGAGQLVQHTAVHRGQRVRYGQGGVGREADQIGQPAGAVHHVQVVIELGIGGGGHQRGAGGGRRAAVAEVGAGHDGPRRDGHADAAGAGQGHQDHAQGAHHAEGRAQGVGDEAGQQERHQQKQLRRDDAQPVIDEEGDGPGAAPQGGDGADEHVDHDHAAHFAALRPSGVPHGPHGHPAAQAQGGEGCYAHPYRKDQGLAQKDAETHCGQKQQKTEDSAHVTSPGWSASCGSTDHPGRCRWRREGAGVPRIWHRSGPPRRGAPAWYIRGCRRRR